MTAPHGFAFPPSVVTARTVVELLHSACESTPEQPLLVFEDGLSLTRRDFRVLVESFTGALGSFVQPGGRVALAMENRAEYLVAFMAALTCRAAIVPLNPEAGPADATHVLRASRAQVIVADAAGRALLDRMGAELEHPPHVIELDGEEPGGLPEGEPVDLASAVSEIQPDDLLAVTFTSGTTGLPKGCAVDHRWALRGVDLMLRVHSYGPDDRIFYPVKFFYMDAFMALLRALQCGGAFVAARRFSVSRFWDVVRDQDVTVLSTIASMPLWLLKAEPSPRDRDHRVRLGIQAQISPDLHEEMDRRWGFPWLENYGMTEAGLIARVPVELADELRGTGSAGPPAPEVEVRILDDDLQPLAPGKVGEIVVRQPGMFRGYLDMPEATAELMHEGWIRTGDLGRLDELGFLYVVGRKKDIVRRSGENISPAEVEEVLRSHPGILDAAVVGVPDPDRGEELKAYVQLVAGWSGGDVLPATVVEHCAHRLARHKVPRYVEFVSEFPRTHSMRIRKEVLRQGVSVAVWDREADGSQAPLT